MFDLKQNKVIVKPEYLLIPEFKKIWDSDSSIGKTKALENFTYIYFVIDFKSPYKKSYPDSMIKGVVRKEVLKKPKWKETKNVKDAINVYKELQYTKSLKTLDAANNALDQVGNYLQDFKIDDLAETSKDRTINNVLSYIEKLPRVLAAIETARSKVEKEITLKSKDIRGKGTVRARELPKKR